MASNEAPPAPRWLGIAAAILLGAAIAACSAGPAPEEVLPQATPEAPGEPDWAALAARRLPLLEPCELPNAPEPVLCGTLEVAEDPAAPEGRTIPLEVVVVPARSETPPDDPVVFFEGGPGGAATRRAIGSIYAGPVRSRDILLIDQRGTGGSNRLDCAWEEEFRDGELREIFPVAEIERCARELSAKADLDLYTTDRFADDVEEVRRRLGYGPINARGASYGTRSMMVFAQRHPESVRSILGIGWISPQRSNLAERGVWAERTLERLGEFCARRPECAAIAPDLAAMTAAAIERLDRGGVRVEMPDPIDPEATLAIDVDRDWLVEQLRLVLYYAFSSQGLAWAVHRIEVADDWRPLVTLAVLIERMFRGSLAHGMVLTAQCSEAMEFDVDRALERGGETLFGNYRLEQQLQGCAVWPHRKKPTLGVETPRPIDAPALLFSGALDPVTPPEYAAEAAELLPRSRHVVLPEGQHGLFDLAGSWECFHQIWADFLDGADAGAPETLDLSCTEAMTRPPFVVDAEGFDAFVAETMVPAVDG